MVVSIALIIPILLIAIIALVVAGTKGESKGGGEQVIKNVYLYLVLFATLMMVIGGSVAAFMATADLVAPAPYYQTFDEFRRWGVEKEATEEIKLSEEELRERYDAMVFAENERQSVRAKNSLIKSFGWIIIPLPIFLYFQRRLLKNKE